MSRRLSRRRFLGVTAAAAGLPLLPFGGAEAAGELAVWRGVALGAVAMLQIHCPDRRQAQGLIDRSVRELRRLEGVFSLYREDSSLSELNRRGALAAPPADLVRLLEECDRFWRLTGGRFDPTVQPLWRLHAAHFARPDAGADGPPAQAAAEARALVGWERVLVGRDRVAFAKRGMALTLNGVAQGYVTDRIADLLRQGGVTSSMIDMGEGMALGAHPDGRPWRVGLADPRGRGVAAELRLVDQAVATSAAAGFRFDAAGRFGHLFDPRSGAPAERYDSVSVVAPSATVADALSTAASSMPVGETRQALRQLPGARAYVTHADGRRQLLHAASSAT